MKKVILGAVTAAVILSLGVTTALAAGPGCGRCFADGGECVYADTDGDGVCDNCGTYHRCGTAGGGNFVDADGDGICDNYGSGQGCGRGGHCGRGDGFRGGRGR